jgi:hypothetical protein
MNIKTCIALLSLTALIFACAKTRDTAKSGITQADVERIAEKHGFLDSIQPTYKPIFGSAPHPSCFAIISIDDLEKHFSQWKHTADSYRENIKFLEVRAALPPGNHPIALLYELYEKFPTYLEDYIEQAGGLDAYNKEKVDCIRDGWTFSIDPKTKSFVIIMGYDSIGRGAAKD